MTSTSTVALMVSSPASRTDLASCLRPWLASPYSLGFTLGGHPHPALVSKGDTRDYTRVRLSSYYSTITGVGGGLVYLRFRAHVLRLKA